MKPAVSGDLVYVNCDQKPIVYQRFNNSVRWTGYRLSVDIIGVFLKIHDEKLSSIQEYDLAVIFSNNNVVYLIDQRDLEKLA